jgi:hypothetical protein
VTMKIRFNIMASLAILICAPLFTYADVLMLKDGQTISGRFMGADQSSVSFSASGQTRRYSIGEINSITFTAPPADAAPLPSARSAQPANNAPTPMATAPAPQAETMPAPRAVNTPPPMMPPPSADTTTRAKKLGYTIHAGSIMTVRMIDPVDSATDQMGQTYRASLDEPIMVDGQPVVPRGADVTVKLTSVQEAGRITGRSALSLVLFDITVQGQKYELSTSEVTQSGSSRGKQTATRVGVGTVLGAAIGAIAG